MGVNCTRIERPSQGVFCVSNKTTCGTPSTACHQRPHATGRSTSQEKWLSTQSTDITKDLRETVAIAVSQVGFDPENVSAHSMRVGVVLALLLARVNMDTIRLVGRWRSNIMLQYLQTTVQTFASGMTARMVQHGGYALIPPAHGG